MDNDVCDDDFDNSCAPRHGWNLSLDEWDQVGQPGDQNLICSMYAKGGGSNCRCVLVPGSETEPLPGPYDVSAATKAGRDAANAVEL